MIESPVYELESKYTFKTVEQAEYVLRSLSIDKDSRKDVTKELSTDGCNFRFKFSSDSMRQLKISYSLMQQDNKFNYGNIKDGIMQTGNNINKPPPVHSLPPSKLMSSLPMSHMRTSVVQQFAPYGQGNMPPATTNKSIVNDRNELFQLAMEGSGDNPGAFFNSIQLFPCGVCDKPVMDDQEGILCEVSCNRWFHRQCTGLTQMSYEMLTKEENAAWACDNCIRFSQIQARFPRTTINN